MAADGQLSINLITHGQYSCASFLCRFDVRGKPLSLGRRWSEVAFFGRRADFRFAVQGNAPSQGQLSIANITLQDEGIYRCRVDFKNSPARHFRVKLNVIGRPLVCIKL